MKKHVLENDLRRALAQNEFEVHFQPIVDTQTLKLNGAEALVRWHHPKKGLIPPDQFIPVAEETGTILQIGEWVLHAACNEARNGRRRRKSRSISRPCSYATPG